jgi:choline-glycine betaine transporter
MLFTAGMAIGLVFWGIAEPITHYMKPPPGMEAPRSPEAAQAAIAAILLLSGGLDGAQTACLVAALPFMVVMLLMMVSLHKALKADAQHERILQEARGSTATRDDRP